MNEPEDANARADARLDAALEDADQQDPRPWFRVALRGLKPHDSTAFDAALAYFQDTLVPAVAGEADPLKAWWEYGRTVAGLLGDGRTLVLDDTGRAQPAPDSGAPSGLVLHIPDNAGAPVLVMRAPKEPTPAQQAALELLVEGRQAASAYA